MSKQRSSPRRPLVGILVACFLLAIPQVAWAAPIRVGRDRADNGYSFTYEADGRISSAASSILISSGSNDRVRFITSVRSHPDRPVGRRLVGRIGLTLRGRRSVLYDGTFILRLSTSSGPALKQIKAKKIILRPCEGQRHAVVRFPFDLPPGDYYMTGRFRAAS